MRIFLLFGLLASFISVGFSFTLRPSNLVSVDWTDRNSRNQALSQLPFFNNLFKPGTTTTTTTAKPETTTVTTPEVSFFSTTVDPLQVLNISTTPATSEKTPTCVSAPEKLQVQSFLSDEYIKSKLCPNISSSYLKAYRFDLDAKNCSMIGKQSHCGKNMVFYSFSGSEVYGHCDCNYSSQIPLLYHAETNRCYFMYQQAYCGPEEWLELRRGNGTSYSSVCTENKCYQTGRKRFGASPLASRDMAPEYVPFRGNGSCVKLNKPNGRYCPRGNYTVAFNWPTELYPDCVADNTFPISILPRYVGHVGTLECTPGAFLNSVGHCQPSWDFD